VSLTSANPEPGHTAQAQEVVRRLQAFKCHVLVYDPVVKADRIRGSGCVPVSMEELLCQSDLVTLHCPSTAQTRRMMNRAAIERMLAHKSGMIGLPLIGAVHVAGLTQAEAEAMIGGLYQKQYLQNPEVSVFVKEYTRQRFTFEGAVGKPGTYPLKGPTSLLQAFALAGGAGSLSNLSDVTLFRTEENERKVTKLDLEKIRNGDAPDPMLQADDLIVVGRSPGRVLLRDSVFGDLLGIFNPFAWIRPY
jgi:protein involved in polysaccharide export with SLBB domain